MELIIEDNLDFNEYKYLRNTTVWAQLSDIQITNQNNVRSFSSPL